MAKKYIYEKVPASDPDEAQANLNNNPSLWIMPFQGIVYERKLSGSEKILGIAESLIGGVAVAGLALLTLTASSVVPIILFFAVNLFLIFITLGLVYMIPGVMPTMNLLYKAFLHLPTQAAHALLCLDTFMPLALVFCSIAALIFYFLAKARDGCLEPKAEQPSLKSLYTSTAPKKSYDRDGVFPSYSSRSASLSTVAEANPTDDGEVAAATPTTQH